MFFILDGLDGDGFFWVFVYFYLEFVLGEFCVFLKFYISMDFMYVDVSDVGDVLGMSCFCLWMMCNLLIRGFEGLGRKRLMLSR